MKFTTLFAFWLVVIVFGAAIASEKKVNYAEKYKIETFKFGDMISSHTVTNVLHFWNEKYPAKLSFSLCSDTECVMITEEIVIKK